MAPSPVKLLSNAEKASFIEIFYGKKAAREFRERGRVVVNMLGMDHLVLVCRDEQEERQTPKH